MCNHSVHLHERLKKHEEVESRNQINIYKLCRKNLNIYFIVASSETSLVENIKIYTALNSQDLKIGSFLPVGLV